MIFATITAGKDAFLLYCNNERGLSKNTIDAYGQDIDVFILFLKRCNEQTVFNGTMILNYLDYLKTERKQKHATIRRRLVALRDWCQTAVLR
jgi:site-specific recombinase XerD